ncbi:MAG TPA: Wzz/FepE/Etk N-terminal domain-containing protein [Steroidobacteraceae bacterium]|jgi:uncharacterized protein involved in exopolysaccharide biosynthesis|nr:Wzz/FepE/Etk N-terminal domain-containing protein [Steroidobacteraceae bacterium]
MIDPQPRPENDAPALGLRELIALLMVRRRWVIGTVALFTVAFTAAAFLITPTYESAVVLVPANTERLSQNMGNAVGQLGGIAALVGLDLNTRGSETNEALAILRSRQFTEAFITARQLMPELYERKWDAERKQWRGRPDSQPTLAKAYKYFDKQIRTVTQDRKTGLVTIMVTWRDRNEAADWANDLAQRLNEEVRTRAMRKADLAVGYLEHELQATTTVATRDAIGRLMEAEVKQRMLANVTQEYAFRVVDRAMPPDRDDRAGPHRVRMIVGGPVAGFALAVLWVYLFGRLRPQSAPQQRG